ncbi:hypothetical protein N7G274_007083 [Stereocaulon virgatum]|uniref:Uncharacterized protein n=1 Tax=Stereocaulon virgatum TaxID=373712 RepID=A0ABR4A414_9LECA
MISKPEVLEVGLAIGQGTGPELADVFTKLPKQLACLFNVQVRVHRSSRIYHSYHSLFSTGRNLRHIREETAQDAAHCEDLCKKQAAQCLKVIFGTAFMAQSQYLVRQHLESVKVELFHKQSVDILLIRDQAQGFYTGSNPYGVDALAVSRACQSDTAIFGRIVSYALSCARKSWGEDTQIDSLTMVYKYHLFDGVFDVWAQKWSRRHGLHIQFIHPDAMNRNILAFGIQSR